MSDDQFDTKVKLVDPKTGEERPSEVLEGAGTMFDPYSQHLDLSKEEKRRTTALMLAINGYKELIIKDADYLREMHNKDRELVSRGEAPVCRSATMDAMVMAAMKFDDFISGKFVESKDETRGGSLTEDAAEADTGAEPIAP